MTSVLLKLVFFSFITGFALPAAQAQYFAGPSVNALGGAGTAARGGSINMIVNPATVALMDSIEADGHYRNGDLSGGRTESFYGLSIADNTKDVIIAGGLTYLRGTKTFGELETQEQYWNVSLGKAGHRWALGVSAMFLDSQVEGGDAYKQYSGTVGLLLLATEKLVLGAVYDSFVNPGSDVPIPVRLTPTSRLGMRWTPEEFLSVRLDVSRREHENPDREGAVHLGFESFVNKYNIIRLGSRIDDFYKQNFATAGWGFNGPRLKLNYSFEKPLKDSNGAMHSVDLLMSF
jgi:hypothetical protein